VPTVSNIYEIPVNRITGEETTLAEHKGKAMLIVNVASACGYTRQYPGLQELSVAYRERGLVVVGFPSNDFGGQEPGTNEEIAAFCTGKYSVDFPMYAKIPVKGADQHPLYKLLTETTGQQVTWNFNKFLVDRDGKIIKRFDSKVEPNSEELRAAIEALL
jgi:glutathione peroxidase